MKRLLGMLSIVIASSVAAIAIVASPASAATFTCSVFGITPNGAYLNCYDGKAADRARVKVTCMNTQGQVTTRTSGWINGPGPVATSVYCPESYERTGFSKEVQLG